MTEIHIAEAVYADPRSGSDKFYRTFVLGSCWVAQYGRNGTVGTFTKLLDVSSEEAAKAAADAKFTSKVKKGYVPSRVGSLTVDRVVDASSLDLLDELADKVPDCDDMVPSDRPRAHLPAGDFGADALPYCAGQIWPLLEAAGIGPRVIRSTSSTLPPRPMLASVLPSDDLSSILSSPDWVAQFKYDGDRVLISVDEGWIRVFNRQGEPKVRNVGRAQLLPFTALQHGRWLFDGEIVGRTLVLFDLVSVSKSADWVTEDLPFVVRYQALEVIAKVMGIPAASQDPGAPVVLAPIASTPVAKAEMLSDAVMDQREGLILRRRAGRYQQGRRSADLLKHKLIKDVDVTITSQHETKESVSFSVYDEAGDLIEVGSASTIGKGSVSLGEVWVVTFLYVTDPAHPRLVQPRLVRRRTDKLPEQCLLDQLAEAGTNRIV